MIKIIKSLSIIIIILIFTGCSTLKTYSSDEYTLEYPNSYSIKAPTEDSKVLTVEGQKGRIEIFKTSDFGIRIHGFSSSGLDEFEAIHVPKEKITLNEYEAWLFYAKEDKQTQQETQDIYNSIKFHQ